MQVVSKQLVMGGNSYVMLSELIYSIPQSPTFLGRFPTHFAHYLRVFRARC